MLPVYQVVGPAADYDYFAFYVTVHQYCPGGRWRVLKFLGAFIGELKMDNSEVGSLLVKLLAFSGCKFLILQAEQASKAQQ